MNRLKLCAWLLGASIVTVASACRDDNDPVPSTPRAGSAGVGGSGGSGAGTAGVPGAGSAGSGNAGAGAGAGTAGVPGAGSGGSAGGADILDVTAVQVTNANDPTAAPVGRLVRLTGLVVTSQKFLLVKSNSSGSCLWAVFATTPGATTQPYGSVILTDYGDKALSDGTSTSCPFEAGKASKIPDDIAPGDVIDVTAFVNEFSNSQCGKSEQNPTVAFSQRQLGSPQITVTAKGGGTVPAPQEFATLADITKLADQANPDDVNRMWQNGLVRITPPAPLTIDTSGLLPGGTCASDGFGTMRFNETPLDLNDDIYFKDTTNGGPKDPNGLKTFTYTQDVGITSLTGIYSLDFCTWSVALRGLGANDIQPPPPAIACTRPPPPNP